MASPLDQVVYNQDAGYLPINLVAGDDLPVQVSFPTGMDISLYTFVGNVLDSFNTVITPFTITKVQNNPGIITASLSATQTALITDGSTYYLQWNNGKIRTFLAGPIVAVAK